MASLFEAFYRISQVRTAIEQRPFRPCLYRTEAFRQLDPTEKAAFSYALGMVFTKLFAHKLLDTHWLLHLDVFKDQLNPGLLTGRSRPDLVGQDGNGVWHAFEAKGRSSVPNAEAKQKAKNQAQRLVRVGRQRCRLHIGAITFFRNEILEFYWCDPAPFEEEPFELGDPKDTWKHYYQLALALSQVESDEMNPGGAGTDVKVKITPPVLELLLQEQWEKAKQIADESRNEFVKQGFFPDGIQVACGESWNRPFGKAGAI